MGSTVVGYAAVLVVGFVLSGSIAMPPHGDDMRQTDVAINDVTNDANAGVLLHDGGDINDIHRARYLDTFNGNSTNSTEPTGSPPADGGLSTTDIIIIVVVVVVVLFIILPLVCFLCQLYTCFKCICNIACCCCKKAADAV